AAAVDLDQARGPGAIDPHRPRASRDPLRNLLRRVRQRARLVGQCRGVPLRLPPAVSLRGPPRRGACRRRQAARRPDRRMVPGRALLQRRVRRRGGKGGGLAAPVNAVIPAERPRAFARGREEPESSNPQTLLIYAAPWLLGPGSALAR